MDNRIAEVEKRITNFNADNAQQVIRSLVYQMLLRPLPQSDFLALWDKKHMDSKTDFHLSGGFQSSVGVAFDQIPYVL